MSIIEGVRRFTESVGDGYSRSAIDDGSEVSSIYNKLYYLCLLHIQGGQSGVICDELEALRGRLQGGLLTEHNSLIGANHDGEYIRLHLSALYYQLGSIYLKNLGPILALKDWSSRDLIKALLGIDNSSAWYASNIIMSYAVLFAHNARLGQNSDCLLSILEHLNAGQDADTGLWFGIKRASKLNAMAATFHYLPLYSYLNVKPAHADRMFDNIANLASRDGFFNLPAGYACLDYDGITSLQYLCENALLKDDRDARLPVLLSIATALRSHLIAMQQKDGGFPEAGSTQGCWVDIKNLISHVIRNRCFWSAAWNARFIQKAWTSPSRIIHANSIRACSAQISESNAFSTWFRYMTVACCEDIIERYGSLDTREAPSRKLILPGLGYF